MKVVIIGKGSVGGNLGKLLRESGKHQVDFAGRTSLDKVGEGEIVILALPFTAIKDIVKDIESLLEGKIVVDATNPLKADWGPLQVVDEHNGKPVSAGEAIQAWFPKSKVVKAFNTVFADCMIKSVLSTKKLSTFVASDDAEARTTVAELAMAMGFATVVEAGPLLMARYLEAMAHLNIHLAVGMGQGTNGTGFVYLGKTNDE